MSKVHNTKNKNTISCPALFISAPASGQGKTTVTAALARLFKNQRKKICVFKTGPDFLDPMILQQACGNPVYQLDMWMGGESHCKQLLYQAACDADIILIEGVMGLFDGDPSSADLAALFNIPILAVIDATAMAQTFGAIAHGLASYRSELKFAGVIANRVASDNHAQMLAESLPKQLHYYGAIPRNEEYTLPSRHLGLVQANEINDLQQRIEATAQVLSESTLSNLPAPVRFEYSQARNTITEYLKNCHIAVAKDAAFSFIYRANIELLKTMGATIHYFSPLTDKQLPTADCLYFPGGYPELHLDNLANNFDLFNEIREHHKNNKPIVAECGGMLYLMDSLVDKTGHAATLTGLLPGRATMQNKLVNLGLHSIDLPEGQIRGHTFHHSQLETSLQPFTMSQSNRASGRGEAVYRSQRLHASYLHMYFPSNPKASAGLFTP